jgi:CTD kinase subunit beta
MERLVLEAIGFDFRSRVPQRLIVKICKYYNLPKETVYRTAFDISIDLYRTFAPLKMTTVVMAMACVELACKLHKIPISNLTGGNGRNRKYAIRLMLLAKRSHVMGKLFNKQSFTASY